MEYTMEELKKAKDRLITLFKSCAELSKHLKPRGIRQDINIKLCLTRTGSTRTETKPGLDQESILKVLLNSKMSTLLSYLPVCRTGELGICSVRELRT